MIKSKGIIYRTVDDVIDKCSKPTSAKYLEELYHKKLFNPDQLIDDFKWKFDSENISWFDGRVVIVGVPTTIMAKQTYLGYLLQMKNNPILTFPGPDDMSIYIEELIDGIRGFMHDKEYEFAHNIEKITEQPSYLWIWDLSNGVSRFLGVYTQIPITLLDGPLSKEISYDCSSCDYFELVTNEIPDFYYDKHSKLYCPKCAEGKKLKHIGE